MDETPTTPTNPTVPATPEAAATPVTPLDQAPTGLLKRAVEILEAAPGWVGGAALAEQLGLDSSRDLRRAVIWPLRCQYRLPIYSLPGPQGGYRLKADAQEHRRCLAWLDQMGRDMLAIRAIILKESLDAVTCQMVMRFLGADEAAGKDGRPVGKSDQLSMLIDAETRAGRKVRWTDTLESMLAIMCERPDVYAEQIGRIRMRHGGIFLSPEKRQAVQAALDQAQELLKAG